MDARTLTPFKPHLIRMILEWMEENNLTPYMVVDNTVEGVHLPDYLMRDPTTTLNLLPAACVDFHVEVEQVRFGTRFHSKHWDVFIPMPAIRALYALELQEQIKQGGPGIFHFDAGLDAADKNAVAPTPQASKDVPAKEPVKDKAPFLKVVK